MLEEVIVRQKYDRALQLFGEEKWTQAIVELREIQLRKPDFVEASELLDTAQREKQKEHWLQRASSYVELEKWQQACEPLIDLLEADPSNHIAVTMAVQVLRGLLTSLRGSPKQA